MNERVAWYYSANVDPWPNTAAAEKAWTRYRDVEIDLIEEAYQEKRSSVLLDRYRIDFDEFLQVRRDDETKQRPVKRETSSTAQQCLREYRFGSTLATSTAPSSASSFGNSDVWCPFLNAWLRSPAGRKGFFQLPTCLEACAQGIIREAVLHCSNSNTEAAFMAEKIRRCAGKSRVEVAKQCIRFYTKDSFLYYTLNEALRTQDYTKLDTLGPLCYLIRNYSRLEEEYIGTVYRGLQLTYEDIESYREHIGEWKTWLAFASASKNRRMAEMFGNTLLIIEITDVKLSSPRAYDIAHLSGHPDEEEVLLPAGVSFQIQKVEQEASQRYLIYVKV